MNYQPYGLTPEQEKLLGRIADALEALAMDADRARTYLIPPKNAGQWEISRVFDDLAKYGDLPTFLLPPGWVVARGHKTTGERVEKESETVPFDAGNRGSEDE